MNNLVICSIEKNKKSMKPILKPEKTYALIVSQENYIPKRGDVVLIDFGRELPVIHRIIKVNKNGTYITMGDNTLIPDQPFVPINYILGVMYSFSNDKDALWSNPDSGTTIYTGWYRIYTFFTLIKLNVIRYLYVKFRNIKKLIQDIIQLIQKKAP